MNNTVTEYFRACLEHRLKTACVSQNFIPKRHKTNNNDIFDNHNTMTMIIYSRLI